MKRREITALSGERSTAFSCVVGLDGTAMAAFLGGEPEPEMGILCCYLYSPCCGCPPVLSYKKQLFG